MRQVLLRRFLFSLFVASAALAAAGEGVGCRRQHRRGYLDSHRAGARPAEHLPHHGAGEAEGFDAGGVYDLRIVTVE